MTFGNKLCFCLNGTSVEIDNPDLDITLLNYVRSIGLTGTKLGCGEGGCGACTIMISSYDKTLDKISHISANACLIPLCSVDGKHIITIEGIGNVKNPHPIQERLTLLHGSQCRFCTPGVVMSLYSLLCNNPNPSEKEAEKCFMAIFADVLVIALYWTLQKREITCKFETAIILKAEYPNATLVSGNTRIGIETEFENIKYDVQIYVGDISELKSWEFKEDGLYLGANMTISHVQAVLKEACNYYKPHQIQIFEALSENLNRFATNQIRNISTLAGNIIANSSTSDLIPLLLSSKSIFSLTSLQSTLKKIRPIPSVSFWTGYNQDCRESAEVLDKIFIPCSNNGQYVRAYEQSKRHYGARAIVNAGLSVLLDHNSHVQEAFFAFGGMGRAIVRASNAENFIVGKRWGDKNVLEQLIEILYEEFQLSFSVTGGMATYRKILVIGFINKFWYDVTKSANIATLSPDIENSIGEIKRSISKGSQTIGRPDELDQTEKNYSYKLLNSKDNKIVGKPISYASAMKQSTGQAIYFDDIPKIEGELYGAFVTSQKAHAKILNIDPTQALNVPGQIIGLLVAETKKIAQEAKDLVKIEYEELHYILTIEEAIEQNSYFPMNPQLARGDVEKGFQEADYIFEEHFYLETNAALVIPKEDDEFEIHSGTQSLASTQGNIARVLGIAANKVTCQVKRVGGAFGGKETKCFFISMALAVGAWHLKKPIRYGKILAYDLKFYLNCGGTTDVSMLVAQCSTQGFDGTYYIPNVRFIGYPCKTNTHSHTAFRGFGKAQAVFITESMLTDVAEHIGIDVNELREKNLYLEGQKTPYIQTLENWFLPEGYSTYTNQIWVAFPLLFLNQAGALVHIYLDGSVLISHGGIEMGQGLNTKMLQIASEALDVPINTVHLMETATNLVINATSTAGSTGSDLNGYAVHNACKILAERLKPYCEKMPDKSFEEAAYYDRVNLSANGFYKTPDIGYDNEKDEATVYPYYTTGAACSEVEIDTLTGDHLILRTDICMDIGRSLNYALDVGQIEGGFIQGVGWCTNEQLLYFPNGNLYTTGPDQYAIPGARDIPQDFRIYTYEGAKSSNIKSIHSSKGIGEPPLLLGCTAFFAIREAIKAVRIPAIPERVHIACDDEIVSKCKVEKKDDEVLWVIEL
ncbi:molybdopterin binding aldehyde oxidase/xanthine dehydrogenase [Gigaspora rosea]|uniref:Molybdopterin binding aldehyde oxidase/xanthine dehydrogenase n=1 Tax=Gigaspora rosea TaxID=44941 RepID=A0A397UY12_9GLOM|nr:molybdopterin binding aldehyde oxidase/xanthine dehydrogenase [Gigaspora rosea]